MEVAVEYQRLPDQIDNDLDDAVDVGLQPRKRHQYSGGAAPGLTKADNNVDGEPSLNTNYLDKNGGTVESLDYHKIVGAVEGLDINKIVKAVENDANDNRKTGSPAFATEEETGESSEQIEEVTEEEVVELEFEKVKPKLDTHTMHCPNCDQHITRVVLRRKIIRKQPPAKIEQDKHDLFGCLSCFSLFTFTDNGCFNPFSIFGNKHDSSAVQQAGVVPPEDGNCFSIFQVFRKEKDSEKTKPTNANQEPQQQIPGKVVNRDPEQPIQGKVNQPPPTSDNIVTGKRPIVQGVTTKPNVGGTPMPEEQLPPSQRPSHGEETHIYIPPGVSTITQEQTHELPGHSFEPVEILKSIVYGGLMEVIASLSIVASASAGGASTRLPLACHNIWDLRDDCYKFSSQQADGQESRTKYKELLGRVEHFPLHVFLAILSFLVFGIIPPVAYGYAFHETSDKDFTIMVVAICAVAVSGVSYAAGNLAMRLIEKLGLFETVTPRSVPVLASSLINDRVSIQIQIWVLELRGREIPGNWEPSSTHSEPSDNLTEEVDSATTVTEPNGCSDVLANGYVEKIEGVPKENTETVAEVTEPGEPELNAEENETLNLFKAHLMFHHFFKHLS
ncbi:membrane protein of ER body-like protein [Tanacetum coccineum]